MPPKQRPKKGGLEDNQIQSTIKLVKQYWPDYCITVENIRNPTRDFILKFYTECVTNLDEKCNFVTRSNLISYPPGFIEEDLIFLKLSRIPSLVNADFKLGDLFIFDPKRVKQHIFVTMHFLLFTETVMDKTVEICNQVFDAKEKMLSNKEELNKVREKIHQKQIQFTQAKEKNKHLKEAAASLTPKYEETLNLIEESQKKCKDSILMVENLKTKLEIQQEEIQKHEKITAQLRKQIVTEGEYDSLKSNLDALVKEEENLEEIDMSDGLFEQKTHIEQLQRCLQELNYLDLPQDLFKLSDVRVQLKNEKQNLAYALTIQQSSEAEINQLKTQLEKQKQIATAENARFQHLLKIVTEKGITEESERKKKYQETYKDNLENVEELKRTVKKYEEDQKRLKNGMLQKYNKIWETQNKVLERLQNVLVKVMEKIEEKKTQSL